MPYNPIQAAMPLSPDTGYGAFLGNANTAAARVYNAYQRLYAAVQYFDKTEARISFNPPAGANPSADQTSIENQLTALGVPLATIRSAPPADLLPTP